MNQALFILGKEKKMYMSLRACYIGPGKCEDYLGDWNTYISMQKRQKVSYFAMELTANKSVALEMSGLEQVRDNWDQDSVMRISK